VNSNPYYIIKAPVITEESTIQTHSRNKYVFKVDPRANKNQIRDAVEKIFPGIKVLSVNTMNYEGKVRRRGRYEGRRADWKKAYVTLRQGDTIELI
jgi:large subunit ribosomal protein L23